MKRSSSSTNAVFVHDETLFFVEELFFVHDETPFVVEDGFIVHDETFFDVDELVFAKRRPKA